LEYIEEPCVSPEDTLRFSAHTGLGVGLDESIDEGWLEQNTSKEYIKSCQSDNNDDHKIHTSSDTFGNSKRHNNLRTHSDTSDSFTIPKGSPKIKALILKPTILGGVLESARTISTARNKFGPPYLSSPVLSSSFETPYTLLYFAQIAGGMAALEKIGISVSFKNSPAHGIGTSNWYASDQNQADSDSRLADMCCKSLFEACTNSCKKDGVRGMHINIRSSSEILHEISERLARSLSES